MNNEFIYQNDEQEPLPKIINFQDINNQNKEQKLNGTEDDFIKELPEWDLEPPYEPVRRVIRE